MSICRACAPVNIVTVVLLMACASENEATQKTSVGSSEFPLSKTDPRAQLPETLRSAPASDLPKTPLKPITSKVAALESVGYDPSTKAETRTPSTATEISADQSVVDKFFYGHKGNLKLDTAPVVTDESVGVVQEKVVIGADERHIVLDTLSWPERTTVKLYSIFPNGVFACSGTLIWTKYVLTSGHCVKKAANGGWAQYTIVIPGLEGTYMPFGDAGSTFFNSYSGWVDNEDSEYDFALITLDRRLGDFIGHTGFCTLSDSSWNNALFDLRGYPVDLWSGQRMYYSAGEVINHGFLTLFHDADTFDGESGSGIDPWGGSDTICGHHNGQWGSDSNYGTKITNTRYDDLISWIGQNDPKYEVTGYNNWIGVPESESKTRPVVTTSKNGRYYDLFITGDDGAVRHRALTAQTYIPTSGMKNLGGNTSRPPAAVSRANGLLDVFIINSNGGIDTKAWNGSTWLPSDTGWWPLGAPSGYNFGADGFLAVSTSGTNRIDVFASENLEWGAQIWHTAWTGNWSTLIPLGEFNRAEFAAVSRAPGLTDIFAVDNNGNVLTKALSGSTWLPSQLGWWNLGRPANVTISGGVAAVSSASDRLDVLVREYSSTMGGFNCGRVFIKTWTQAAGWGGWGSLGGCGFGRVTAVSRAANYIDFFALDQYGHVMTKSFNGSTWWPSASSWSDMGGQRYYANVAATTSASNRIDVFSWGHANQTDHRFWNGSSWN